MTERKRRARLYLEATKSMNDYASQARNAVSGEPQKVLIVFDTILSRKASRYFVAGEQEQKNIIEELKAQRCRSISLAMIQQKTAFTKHIKKL